MDMPGSDPHKAEHLDRFGAVASSLCAIHCALCALMPAALGALGLGALLGHNAEWVFTLIAIAFALSALALGWRRHRSKWVVGVLTLGVVGLLVSRGLEMGSGHHHDEHHAVAEHDEGHGAAAAHESVTHHDASLADSTHDAHHDDDDHGSVGHAAGTVVGVLAGILLLFGHILNIRATRQEHEECC